MRCRKRVGGRARQGEDNSVHSNVDPCLADGEVKSSDISGKDSTHRFLVEIKDAVLLFN